MSAVSPIREINLVYLSGKTPEDIQAQLGQLNLPYAPIAAYSIGSTHILVISTSETVLFKTKEK